MISLDVSGVNHDDRYGLSLTELHPPFSMSPSTPDFPPPTKSLSPSEPVCALPPSPENLDGASSQDMLALSTIDLICLVYLS